MLRLEKHGIAVECYEDVADALYSIKLNGKEMIDGQVGNGTDSGRGVTIAGQYWDEQGSRGEDYNPTEGGQAGVLRPNKSASIIKQGEVVNGQIRTSCLAAYWFPYRNKIVSDTLINKTIDITPGTVNLKITIIPNSTGKEPNIEGVNWEILTGYLPDEFSRCEFVGANEIVNAPLARQISNYPAMISSPDGNHAMGIYVPDVKDPMRYSVWRFPQAGVVKWSAAFTDTTPDRQYVFQPKVYVGTRAEVIARLRNKKVSPPEPEPETCEEYYLRKNPDVAQHSFYGSRPKLHWDRHGRSEGREACAEWFGGNTCGSDYLRDNPDVAASSTWKNDPEGHYAEWGRNENRKVCPTWRELYPPTNSAEYTLCEREYRNRYDDLRFMPPGGGLENHYANFGKNENRQACAEWVAKYEDDPAPTGMRPVFMFADAGTVDQCLADQFDGNEYLHLSMVLATCNHVNLVGFSCEAGSGGTPPTKAGLNRILDNYGKANLSNDYSRAAQLKSRVHLGAARRGMGQALPPGGHALVDALSKFNQVYVPSTAPATTLAITLEHLISSNRVNLARRMVIIQLGDWNFFQDQEAWNYIWKTCKQYNIFCIMGRWKQYAVKQRFPKTAANNWVDSNMVTTVWGDDIKRLIPHLRQLNGHSFKESDHVAWLWCLRNLVEGNKGNIDLPADFRGAWFPHMKRRTSGDQFDDELERKGELQRGVNDNADRIIQEMFTVDNWMGKQLRKFT